MKREEITKNLKSRFCKNYNIPISIFDEPFFTSRIELYDKYYNTKALYEMFIKDLEEFKCEEDYFSEYNRIKQEAIDFIKTTEGFERFNSEDMNKFAINTHDISEHNIYNDNNIGKKFTSIDMVKSNFSSLSYYDPYIFTGIKDYERFMSIFTKSESIIKSKYIRQVIFGNCNPKRQTTYSKYLMSCYLEYLIKNEHVNINNFVSFSTDEIILNDNIEMCNGVFSFIINDEVISLKALTFTLEKVNNSYIRRFSNGSIDIKCASSVEVPFIIRKLNNEQIQDLDAFFYYEGRLAKFIL